ncbi:hypothetical protein [Budvicia diplopodorum]|uniref:hypothetical protein n=1 Tax=Budvicia diplopodorum TaxID=1119056 RepID=UPI001359DC25|nr:hypothetical protein [Budvicia diplopodorum]
MNKIKWITQAIAQPSSIQKELFPDFANVADELAVEWELALDEVNLPSITILMSDEQKASIKRLDDYMLSISGPTNIQFWNDDALCHSSEWEYMRTLAREILLSMGWEMTAPAKSDAIYINKG